MSFFKAKHVLFKEGQPAKNSFKVVSGEVLCLKFTNGRLVPVMLATKGHVIGENALIHGGKYDYSAIVLDNGEIETTSSETYWNEFKTSPQWMPNLINTMLSRLNNTANLLAENRVIHSSIYDEQHFTSAVEIEYKKLLGL